MPTARRRAFALCALALLLAAPVHAQQRSYLVELGAGGAVTSFAGVTDLGAGFGGVVRLGLWLPLNLGLEVEGTSSSPSTAAGPSLRVTTLTGFLLYNIRSGRASSFFLEAGLGTSTYGSSSCPAVSVPGTGPCGTSSTFEAGAGFRAALSPVLMIRGDGKYQHNGQSPSFANLVGTLGLSVMLGSKPLIDSDQDGVYDRHDKCPGTPLGAIVDKKGCPSDTDQDGVPDGLDRCPDTPAGATVNSVGCPSDTDKDGVVDGVDQCPDTPAGAQVNAAGCPVDTDGDGVPDGLDRCPDTPAGATVDALGCPGDADNDRVPDGIDQCPDTPPGVTVNSFGCPVGDAPPRPAPGGAGGWVVSGMAFAPSSSTIGSAALPVLDSVATALEADQRLKVEIVGHADEAPTETANIQLSLARADAVRNYLLSRGARPGQVQARGAGSTGADPNGPPAENRRIEIKPIGS